MPFIQVKTNQNIDEMKTAIKSELGQAITAIPGKTEGWLMIELEGNKNMYFKGTDEPCAMFEIDIFGKAEDNAYDDLTKRICAISEKYLKVSPERTYVKYTEINHWGYNNFNF
ncbi:MAG: phenylpyruvate tautomerase MIF-related protein [Clostridium sp.]|nr:phenylpyruvate tautomerase MIF-related protein [Clostridium sp.]